MCCGVGGGRKDGAVERVVLRRMSVGSMLERVRRTFLPITPRQAIEGVAFAIVCLFMGLCFLPVTVG